MSLKSTVKIFAKFEDSLLLNEASSLSLSFSGATPILREGIKGNALQLNADTYLYSAKSLGITNGFTIGFWLKPYHPGMAIDGTNAIVPLKMSLLSKAVFVYSFGDTTTTSYQFVIWEETQSSGNNVMKCGIKGATSATATSKAYSPNSWTHFWIAYSGLTPSLMIYVDGDASTSQLTGTIPTTLSSTTGNFEINRTVTGNLYNVIRNTGVIDELMVSNISTTAPSKISRAINLGVEYVVDTALSQIEEVYCGILANDPESIQVVGAANTNADVLVGRSDGVLMKGHRGIWQHRRSFTTSAERALLNKKYGAAAVVTDGLVTTTAMIRS